MNYSIPPMYNDSVNPRLQPDNDVIHEGKALLQFLAGLNSNMEQIHHKLLGNQIDVDMYLYEPSAGTILLQGATTPGGFRGVWKLSDVIANWLPEALNTAGTISVDNSVTSPGAGATIATIPAGSLPAGEYQVTVVTNISGTTGAGDNNNTQLVNGASTTRLDNGLGVTTLNLGNILMSGANALTVQAVAAGTVGAVYAVQIIATPITTVETVTLQIKERIIPLVPTAGVFQLVGLSGNILVSERDKITLTVTPAVPCFLEALGSADYRKMDRQET